MDVLLPLIPKHPEAKEVVIADGRIAGVDNAAEFECGPETKLIDLNGRRVIPGLYDSDAHAGRDQRCRPGYAGLHSASLLPSLAQSRGAQSLWVHQGYTQSSRRRNRPGQSG